MISTVNNPNNLNKPEVEKSEGTEIKTINPSTDLGHYCVRIFDAHKHNMKTFVVNNATVQIELVGDRSIVAEIK